MEPWNNVMLLEPPIHTTELKKTFDTNELKQICSRIIEILSKQSPLHREGAICSRFVYKFDMKFRHDIGYRHLKKLNTGLKKYLNLNIMKDIEKFTFALPSDRDECYYPTRQMLEYVLVRILTFSKILLRINLCSKQSAVFYLDRIKRGDMHWMCLMPYALLSRIWSISKVLVQHSTHWYASLYKYLNKLQYKGMWHLPENYTLPENIKRWLNLDSIDDMGRFEWSLKKYIHVDPTLISNEDADGLFDILGFVNQLNDECCNEELPTIGIVYAKEQLELIKPVSIDQGEVISRENFNVLNDFNNKMKYNKYNHSFETVTNSLSLQEFIDKEESFRNDNNKMSLTNHLSLMQWHALKKALLSISSLTVGNSRKIQRKLLKVWKEKCVDYL